MTPEALKGKLTNVRDTSDPKWRWAASCPTSAHEHGDADPSLSIGLGDDHKLLLHCHMGCELSSILQALHLTPQDLDTRRSDDPFAPEPVRRRILLEDEPGTEPRPPAEPPGCTVARLAAFKQLPVDLLESLGLRDVLLQGQPAVSIPVCDANGIQLSTLFRLNLTRDPRFRWKSNDKQRPFGVPYVAEARAAGYLLVMEGFTDFATARFHHIPAYGLPSATYQDDWAEHFADIATIFVLLEPDQGGVCVERKFSRSSLVDRVKFVRLNGFKDLSELHQAHPEHADFRQRLNDVLAAAVSAQDIADRATAAETSAAWTQCRELAESPDILARFRAALHLHGIAGEEQYAQGVYLSMTSRFEKRPISLVAKGPSSAGKSYILSKVLDFFPSRAYFALTGVSERSLIYSTEPTQHRMYVIFEAAGLASEWAQYLLRSLLSEGCIRYLTTEKDEDGHLVAREVYKPGPSGLLTTTTKLSLDPEMETRLLSMKVDDSQAQTQRVMDEQARVDTRPAVDFAPWHALQLWLQTAEHRAIVPYALRLARLIPPRAVRLRRDFPMLLAFLRAHAVLHQCTRERDPHGRILANLADYHAAYALLADLLAEEVEVKVNDTVRQTVEAVKGLGASERTPVSVKQVADRLELDQSATLRRVWACLRGGFLRNLNEDPDGERKGRRYALVLGATLPDDASLLPTPERLAESETADAPTDVADADSWPADFAVHVDSGDYLLEPPVNSGNSGNGDGAATFLTEAEAYPRQDD